MLQSIYRNFPSSRRAALRRLHACLLKCLAYIVAPVKLARFYLGRRDRVMLHVGCGSVRFDGWVNADLDPRADLVVNLSARLPFLESSVRMIYSEHVLEHLTVKQGLRFLRESRRVLEPGGVIRIAMPDLDDLVAGYNGDWRRFDWLRWPGHEFIQTRAEMMNVAMRWWGHQYLYNREELERRLREAGFGHIEFLHPGSSSHPELRELETRADSTLVVEATK